MGDGSEKQKPGKRKEKKRGAWPESQAVGWLGWIPSLMATHIDPPNSPRQVPSAQIFGESLTAPSHGVFTELTVNIR